MQYFSRPHDLQKRLTVFDVFFILHTYFMVSVCHFCAPPKIFQVNPTTIFHGADLSDAQNTGMDSRAAGDGVAAVGAGGGAGPQLPVRLRAAGGQGGSRPGRSSEPKMVSNSS